MLTEEIKKSQLISHKIALYQCFTQSSIKKFALNLNIDENQLNAIQNNIQKSNPQDRH
jgi:hypothetical protein